MTLDELFEILDTIIKSEKIGDPEIQREFRKKRTAVIEALCCDYKVTFGVLPEMKGKNKKLGKKAQSEIDRLYKWAKKNKLL